MTELDNASLHLYSMTSKGVNIKKELIKIVGKFLNLRFSNKVNKSDPSKILILHNINVFINKGDRIGLIGANGSGKSTILKLLSGIYKPSTGRLKGDYFYPMIIRDLNVSDDLAGIDAAKAFFYQHELALLGYELDWFVSKIEETCTIGDYFLRPIKYYSEGMRTRLIFSLL